MLSKKSIPWMLIFLFFSITVSASHHYTFEHAEEMRTSGRIDWQEYGPDAFSQAITENKPIFLMLTAPTWCYWCHVYTSDDYVYHPSVYPIINEQFIPIYVDADKRQDLTRQYLEGGWPSTTVMTPNRERMYGYSGPRPIQNMITNLQGATEYVSSQGFSNTIQYQYEPSQPRIPSQREVDNLALAYAQYLVDTFDAEHGGFGTGQKFPQGRALDFSLEMYEQTKQVQWIDLVLHTLENQYTQADELETDYNLFDPLDGGFHRYGTTRQWTPPHFEKMLYDNARLLKAYARLEQLVPDNALVAEVVEKTDRFIQEQWYDDQHGGFYGNNDVHGEAEYFGKNPRPSDKPRVEKTKYSDWNSDAILAYLFLYEITQDSQYKEIVEQSLSFFASEMVSDQGALHYRNPDGEKGVQGSLLDNAYLLLAFISAYEVLGNEEYLSVARMIADFSLSHLYDWNSGGFFERHSQQTELYAPGEHIRLNQPSPENGVMNYGILKLFLTTNDTTYLNAGIKTMGRFIDNVGGHDRGYYHVKSAQLISSFNLLEEYQRRSNEITDIEEQEKNDFWLTSLLQSPGVFQPSSEGIRGINASLILLIIIAFIAGVLSFISPCTLPILPAYVAHSLGGTKKNIKLRTIFFFLGLITFFTLLGMTATTLGSMLQSSGTLFSQLAGIGIIIVGIFILLGKGLKNISLRVKKPTTVAGSFLFGAAMGLSWTPCEGFILVALLVLASTVETALSGGLLLFVYGLGLALPLLLVTLYLDRIDPNSKLWKIIKGKEFVFTVLGKKITLHSTSVISGLLFIVLGYLMFSGLLFTFNQYVGTTGFQKFLFGVEEWLLQLVD